MKTAIVTGASGNMGQCVVRKFLAEGYHVVATIVPNDPTPFEIVDAKLEKVLVDLMNEEDSGKFIKTVIAKYENIDAAILTVGGFAMGTIADTQTADIYKQYKLNFETAYNVARPAFVQMMQQGSGRIFIIGSRPGMSAKEGKGMVAYGLGKSLIFRLAELMNEEAKGHNVVTTVVVPSTIDTPQNRKAMPDAKFENWVRPESIADAIYYYCTPAAATIREPVIKVYNNA
ncbi:MAG: family NAD(P)-dependent oxidoreductase [Ferruginibacter sp.]|uniref:SDR family NAD(P)-dependent oxidoreductase n=1 Tax=Ferruginibacter sp. TaxID=1940288 RepID=UPI00265A5FF4|nr:SDR family NAD(P)-dependent oxidoreductase [Ferruginibacter sp.]MDB5275709.1 family NAD(P)-dependent oxidoreductase [Ferruginibacter sp.]